MNKTKKGKLKKLPGVILGLIALIAAAVFSATVISTQMLSTLYIGLVIAACAVATIIAFCLLVTDPRRHKVRFSFGVIWLVLCIAVYSVAGVLISNTQNTLRQIADSSGESVNVSFYVKAEDPATTLEEARDYTFGILASLDRENTDAALSAVEERQGFTLQIREYNGLTQLADALLDGEVGGIVLNEGYVDVYDEIPNYTDFADQIRALQSESLEQTQNENAPSSTAADDGVINIYISGSDTRESTLPVRGRSDVNIIASVNLNTHKVLLLSTPRDYYVPLSISGGARDKLTHAGIYGVQVSMDTLEMLYDMDIDYYFRINFTGFEKIVDALGGIEVYSDIAFDSRGAHFEQGVNHLNGEEALIYCRERYAYADGDRHRGQNQMDVIKAIAEKAVSPSILKNYLSVLDSLQDYMETSVPYDLIAQVVQDQLSGNPQWDITSYSVDGTGDYAVPYSMSVRAYVMVPDTSTVEEAKSLLAQIAQGD